MSFVRMCNAVSHLLPRVYEHPFNEALLKGTLPKPVFRSFLEQDSLYLLDFSLALKTVSMRLAIDKHDSHAREFKKFSNEVIEAERNLHLKYLGEPQSFGLFQSKQVTIKKIPIISHYTEYLLKTAHFSPIEEAVASLIPCFWLYSELGKKMLADPSYNIHNPYHLWILSYADQQFISSATSIINIAEEIGYSNSCPIKQKNIVSAFVTSTQYEILFWDNVYDKNRKMDISNELPTPNKITLR